MNFRCAFLPAFFIFIVNALFNILLTQDLSTNEHWNINDPGKSCRISNLFQGLWYFDNDGVETELKISQNSADTYGECIKMRYDDILSGKRNTYLFSNLKCVTCASLLFRTPNVLEFKKGECISDYYEKSMAELCDGLEYMQYHTLFASTPNPVDCRSSIEGVYEFSYRYDGTRGWCNYHSDQLIRACTKPGDHYYAHNTRFYMNYSRCDGIVDRIADDPYSTSNKQGKDRYRTANIVYSCLGSWEDSSTGNQYFAVANLGESQKHLKYRCFLQRRDQPRLMTKSDTATCKTLKNAREGPEMLIIQPSAKHRASVIATCSYASRVQGSWINTANHDAHVHINSTHISETVLTNQRMTRTTYYVCLQNRGTYYLTARLSDNGCQVDYVCWDFKSSTLQRAYFEIPHSLIRKASTPAANTMLPNVNIKRYRRSSANIDKNMDTVCGRNNFKLEAVNDMLNEPIETYLEGRWKYSLLIAAAPRPIPCPIQGRFTFQQVGQTKLVDRILGGITAVPQVQVNCAKTVSEFKSCPASDSTVISIDVSQCASLDAYGRPLGEYDRTDYKLTCVAYWREDSQSHFITLDESDRSTIFRCWIYTRVSPNTFILSRSMHSYCGPRQTYESWNATDGANLMLYLTESERLYDNCPTKFNPGDDPIEFRENVLMLNHGTTYKLCNFLLIIMISIPLSILITSHI